MDNNMICGEVWLCGKGHLLGVARQVVMRDQHRVWKVDVLYKLRNARICDAAKMTQVPSSTIDCCLEGTVRDIRCSVPGCGEKRTWWQGEQSINRLLAKMGVVDVEG